MANQLAVGDKVQHHATKATGEVVGLVPTSEEPFPDSVNVRWADGQRPGMVDTVPENQLVKP